MNPADDRRRRDRSGARPSAPNATLDGLEPSRADGYGDIPEFRRTELATKKLGKGDD